MKICNIEPVFSNDEARENAQKMIEMALYQVFSKYFDKEE